MYLDILIGIIFLITLIRGYKNGFLISILSLFGVVVNLVLTKILTPKVMDYFKLDGDQYTYVITYVGILLGTYVAVTIFLAFIKSFIKNHMRNIIDVSLGVVFGLLKGSIISFIIILLYNVGIGYIEPLSKYGEESVSNKVFVIVAPLAREWFPETLGDIIENSHYKKNIDEYIEKVSKELS